MGKWTILLGGLTIWAAHFFLVYGFASIWPDQAIAHVLAGIATLAGFAANIVLLRWIIARRRQDRGDPLDRWVLDLGLFGAILSIVSIAWQGLPVLLV